MEIPTGVVKARTNLTASQVKRLIERVMRKYGGKFSPEAAHELRTSLGPTPPFQTQELVPLKQLTEMGVPKLVNLPPAQALPTFLENPRQWQPLRPRAGESTVLESVPSGHPLETAAGISYRTEKQTSLTSPTVLRVLKQKLEQYPDIPGKEIAAHLIEGVGAWKEFVQGIRLQKDVWKKYVGKQEKAQEKFLSIWVDRKINPVLEGSSLEEGVQQEFVKSIQEGYPVKRVDPGLSAEELANILRKFTGGEK
jgi:hypothetical protein